MHLQRSHRVSRKQAEFIADEVSRWSVPAGLVEYASELEVPSQVIQPIHELPVYRDGLMCQVDPERCHQIFRSAETIRKHWQKTHDWLVAGKGGRPSQVETEKIQARISKNCKTVHCQRFFVQGQGSQYFEVQKPGEDGPDQTWEHSSISND
jgi:uncharacterized C2H2 Zn-finger protein